MSISLKEGSKISRIIEDIITVKTTLSQIEQDLENLRDGEDEED